MKCYGNKHKFALEFNDFNFGLFKCWINDNDICSYRINDNYYECHCHIQNIREWFINNIEYIINESEFPLNIFANNSIDYYSISGEFDAEDLNKLYNWYKIRQEWFFKHSWYSCRTNEYIPNVFFRRTHNKIEISWDSADLYDEIVFDNPKGIFYLDLKEFKQIVSRFISDGKP